MQFEWDNNKRKKNIAKHKIDFADAALIFYDNNRIEAIDEQNSHNEIRYRTIGVVKNILLFVVYTKRSKKYRIISARRATKYEEETYYLYAQ